MNLENPSLEQKSSPEKSSQESPGFLSWIRKKIPKKAEFLFAVGMLMGTVGIAKGQGAQQEKVSMLPKTEQGSTADIPMEIEEEKSTERSFDSVGGDWAFTKQNEKGETVFDPLSLVNPWTYVSPAQLDVSWNKMETYESTITIPYEYARAFNSATPLDPEDYQKAQEYLKGEIQKKVADVLIGFDMNKDVYNKNNPGENPETSIPDGIEVTSMSVTGYASPEAEKYGIHSIESGNIQKENIDLAKLRGAFGQDITLKQLEEMGISTEYIAGALEAVDGEEIQFTDAEFQELAALSSPDDGSDAIERVACLISRYNNNEITDATTKERLDALVGEKRKVELKITFEGAQEKTVLIPLPLLLLLLPAALRFGRRTRDILKDIDFDDVLVEETQETLDVLPPRELEEPGKPAIPLPERFEVPVPPAPDGPTPILDDPDFENVTWREWADTVPHFQPKDPKPAYWRTISDIEIQPLDTPEGQEMEENTVIDDLGIYFDDPKKVSIGLDYKGITQKLFDKYDTYAADWERETYATYFLLEQWKKHDAECRRRAGWSEEHVTQGLDYENQLNQVQYARMHAKVLCEMAKEAKKSGEQKPDFRKLLDTRVEKMQQQRFQRQTKA